MGHKPDSLRWNLGVLFLGKDIFQSKAKTVPWNGTKPLVIEATMIPVKSGEIMRLYSRKRRLNNARTHSLIP